MLTVYALYNAENDKIYIGQTLDVEVRLKQHNEKLLPRAFTSRYSGVWQLIYSEQATDRTQALLRERQLKSYRGREFIRRHIPR